VNGYLAAFSAAREEHGLTGQQPDLNAILRLPGALQSDSRGDDDQTALTESVQREIAPLLEELKIMRAREGEALMAILHGTLDRLAEATEGVATLRPEVEERYQARLTERLLAATGPEFNRQRLLEEVAVMVERSDIAEELTRMTTHIGHFRELLAGGGEIGKKLDFLLQEMIARRTPCSPKPAAQAARNTHHRTWIGHEVGDRKSPRTDSERRITRQQARTSSKAPTRTIAPWQEFSLLFRRLRARARARW